ncbi:hypothetical protein pipiens_008148 [Culex pipiens pipiens]|uniref:DnaJ-like protein 60 n=2 Tax=Culex pipiens TaxID=7175 RepID=A0A8D8INA3_CULPI
MYKISRKLLCDKIVGIHQIRYAHQTTHYEILKLKSTCTPKEIREAFIRLSKELHPDANVSNAKRASSDKSFIQLLEAYKVLSKPDSRASYDYELSLQERPYGHQVRYNAWQPPNPAHYATPDPDSFYGIKGIKKVSNRTIVFYCGIFMLVGIILQAIAISKSFTFKRKQLDDFSRKNALQHAEVRAEAESLGNDGQLERMKATLKKEVVW